jgi:hypothetical protein
MAGSPASNTVGLLASMVSPAGDGAGAHEAREAAPQYLVLLGGGTAALQRIWNAEAALADRDLAAARR